LGKIGINPRAGNALQHATQTMQLQNPPEVWNVSNQLTLTGHGLSPNYAETQATLTSAGKTEAPIVLAATEDQLKLAPVQQLQPGAAQLRVTNSITGQSTEAENVLLYSLRAELKREKIQSGGDKTQLVVTTEPAN